MAVVVCGQLLQQLEPELFALACRGAGMGLVHHDAIRRDGEEMLPVAFALDIIQADDDERVLVEKPDAGRQRAFDAVGAGGRERHGPQMEPVFQLRLPLVHQVRRAQDRAASDFAAIQQLADDESGLDGFADAHVIRDEQADHRQPQCHEQRHELIGAGLDGDVAERAEWPGPVAEFQMDGIPQQSGRLVAAVAGRIGQREDCRFRRCKLQFRQDQSDVFLGTAERT